jgi:hypothetical protein
VHFYSSGFPLNLGNSVVFPNFAGNRGTATTYEGWNANRDNADWKGADRYFVEPSYFGLQPTDITGNTTRYNPKARYPWQNEVNFSLAKSFPLTERFRLDFRWEMFNAFNKARFNTGSRNVDDPNFGRVTNTLNEPRRMQLGLKLYF